MEEVSAGAHEHLLPSAEAGRRQFHGAHAAIYERFGHLDDLLQRLRELRIVPPVDGDDVRAGRHLV